MVSVNCTMEDSDSVEFKRSADDETRGPLEQAQHIIDVSQRYAVSPTLSTLYSNALSLDAVSQKI